MVVDVLEAPTTPTAAEDLEVVVVRGPSPGWSTAVSADRGEAPKVLPFQVRDADGATAVASVYIPPTGDGLPYVLPGSSSSSTPGPA